MTYPTGYIVANSYNSYGYLEQVKDSTNTTLWTANETDASGDLKQFTSSLRKPTMQIPIALKAFAQ